MTIATESTAIPDSTSRAILLILAVAAYFGPAAFRDRPHQPRGQFVALAEAITRGELTFAVEQGSRLRTSELIPAEAPGRFYCANPPLPAVLLIPFVFAMGLAVTVEAFTRAISVAIVFLIDLCLARLPNRLGLANPSPIVRLAFTACFAFGTMIWPNADLGMDWHLAHAVALAAMLLALNEYAGENRSWLVGVFIGLAMLSRPTTALTCSFFVFETLRLKNPRDLIGLLASPIAAVAILATYNQARFGSPFDFGYDRMLLTGEGARLMQDYGQFNLAFVRRNLFWFFAAPPGFLNSKTFPWMGYDPRGMSLFIATPLFLYAVLALVRRFRREPIVRHAAIAVLLALIPLVTYFNTGYWQFGHRFGMDYLPLLMVLTIIGTQFRWTGATKSLIALSIFIHAVGVIGSPVAKISVD